MIYSNCQKSDFRDYFRKTALERPGWVGLRRNFLIAAANQKPTDIEMIENHIHHSHEVIRETAKDLLDWLEANPTN